MCLIANTIEKQESFLRENKKSI